MRRALEEAYAKIMDRLYKRLFEPPELKPGEERCLLCHLDPTDCWVRRPDGSTLEVCGRCAEELTAEPHDYTWGGYL